MNLSKEQLQFFYDEVLGELGWCDEIEETGVDPLAYVRDEISGLRRHIKRLEKSLEMREAASSKKNIYLWFFENVMAVVEKDEEPLEFSRSIANELRRTFEKLEEAESSTDSMFACPTCKDTGRVEYPCPNCRSSKAASSRN